MISHRSLILVGTLLCTLLSIAAAFPRGMYNNHAFRSNSGFRLQRTAPSLYGGWGMGMYNPYSRGMWGDGYDDFMDDMFEQRAIGGYRSWM